LEKTQLLITILELSIALAGFSGIVATFQFAQISAITRGNATGLSMILNFSLMAAFMAAIPLSLLSFGLTDSQVWTISSVLLTFGYLYHIISTRKNHMQFKVRKKITRIIFASIYLMAISMMIMNLLNAFNIVFHKEFGPVLISMLVGLGIACIAFARMLIRPIWRIVLKKESENLNNDDIK